MVGMLRLESKHWARRRRALGRERLDLEFLNLEVLGVDLESLRFENPGGLPCIEFLNSEQRDGSRT